MALSRDDVHYIAALARLHLSEPEEERMARELSRVLDYVAQLDALDTSAVPPMTHVLDLHNVVRPDEVRPRVRREDALAAAPAVDDAYFRVPKVIE